MANIAQNEGNTKENYSEILLPPMRVATIKTKQRTNVGEGVEKLGNSLMGM